MDKSHLTKSGIIVRKDESVGYLLYSPYTGLFFAAKDTADHVLVPWLEGTTDKQPPQEYVKALGPGWQISELEAEYPAQHLLPTSYDWSIVAPKSPILINWFLTGMCCLDCIYCYAQDLMNQKCQEPSADDIIRISDAIISCNPLAVVLTGGDPLMSPHLSAAVEALHSKCGIIIDTSGYGLTDEQLNVFSKMNVFVRISLDSEIPRLNEKLRPIRGKKTSGNLVSSTEAALDAINRCLDKGIKVGVQTVVTKYNRSDLETLGDKLYRLGISNWRIMLVAPSKERLLEYGALKGDEKGVKRYFNHIVKELRQKHKNWWHQGMAIQLTHNKTPNAVVLVAPDGTFYTESNVRPGKDILFEANGLETCGIFNKVNIHAHAERYLNLNYY